VYAALGVWEGAAEEERLPDRRRGEGIGPVALAAEQAVRDPGTEVSATEIAGHARGPRGRWAKLLRRPRRAVPEATDPVHEATDPVHEASDAVPAATDPVSEPADAVPSTGDGGSPGPGETKAT
jgi:hypothetical protein